MIPESDFLEEEIEIDEDVEISRTYNVSNNEIQGFVDELKALEQCILKILSTERYEYSIYSFDYGIDLESLIGKDTDYVMITLRRIIKECILQDDRIEGVENFKFQTVGDSMTCNFDVVSIYGNIQIAREVGI